MKDSAYHPHRLQTVKEADDIIVLDSDEDGFTYVRERGTHEDLVAQ
jgi:ABC-type transport system involved in Fe-S cluster assembly fused permease/ATPase subunit